MRISFWPLLLVTGCGFDGGRGTPPDGPTDAPLDAEPDAPPIQQIGVDFLPDPEETFGDTDWTIDINTTIDTMALTITPPAPAGVTLLEGTQQDGLSKVAILRVKDFKISANRSLTVSGPRPLFILSAHDVSIDGLLDVGARGAVPGPGGSSGGMGPGAGAPSVHDGTGMRYDDSGGGGGSFGTAGAAGGKAGATMSAAGAVYAIANKLVGGASGGTSGACTNPPGAGGGALLLYAMHKIDFKMGGVINAGGGGGAGGVMDCATGAGGGAGGGSGGTIWLQSPDINGDGTLAANGGGGGGASYLNVGNGGPGQDGKPSANMVATGGTKAGVIETTPGGSGATQAMPASLVPDLTAGNGGGGGGGLGRIVYRSKDIDKLKSSPTAVVAP